MFLIRKNLDYFFTSVTFIRTHRVPQIVFSDKGATIKEVKGPMIKAPKNQSLKELILKKENESVSNNNAMQ